MDWPYVALDLKMINLLPPLEEKEIQKERQLRIVLVLGITLCFFCVFLLLVLLAIKVHISGELDIAKNSIAIQEKSFNNPETESLRKNIAYFNDILGGIDAFYGYRSIPSLFLEKLYASLPEDLYLTKISWQKKDGNVEIFGFARSRQTLFSLKGNLEKEEVFEGVYFPPLNWIKPDNIDFQAKFRIK